MIFHRHRWEVVSASCDGRGHSRYALGTDWGLVTDVAMRCGVCGDVMVKQLAGYHTLESLRGEADEVSRVLRDMEKHSG